MGKKQYVGVLIYSSRKFIGHLYFLMTFLFIIFNLFLFRISFFLSFLFFFFPVDRQNDQNFKVCLLYVQIFSQCYLQFNFVSEVLYHIEILHFYVSSLPNITFFFPFIYFFKLLVLYWDITDQNLMDRGDWRAIAHRLAKSQRQLTERLRRLHAEPIKYYLFDMVKILEGFKYQTN